MRFGTRVVAELTAALVMALAGAQTISAGTLPASLYPAKAPAPGTGVPLLVPAGVGSSNTLPAGLYPAKAPAPGKGVPLLVPAGVGSSNTAASAHGLDCYPVQGFKSEANDRYVAAELDYGIAYPRHNLYGMLRARANTVGAWEEHQFCNERDNPCLWAIFTNANARWASTEIGYPGRDKYMLRARATSVGPWEQYLIGCIKGGGGSFVIVSYAEAPVLHYVTAELGYTGKDYGMLRARTSTAPGAWERFSSFPGCPS